MTYIELKKLQEINKLCMAVHQDFMNGKTLTLEQEAILYLEGEGVSARQDRRDERSARLAAQGKLTVFQRMVDKAEASNATVIGVRRIKDVLESGLEGH